MTIQGSSSQERRPTVFDPHNFFLFYPPPSLFPTRVMQPHVFLSLSDVINRNRKRADSVTWGHLIVDTVLPVSPNLTLHGLFRTPTKRSRFHVKVSYFVLCSLLGRNDIHSECCRSYVFPCCLMIAVVLKSEVGSLVRQDRFTFTYVVASESSRNHFISEKCKTVQSLKLHFLQYIFLCNCTLLPATV